MSYQIYDVNGFVGDFATNTGMEKFRRYIQKVGDNHIIGFIKKGAVLVIPKLLESIESFSPKEPDIKQTNDNLIKLLKKCELVAIINNGIEGEL